MNHDFTVQEVEKFIKFTQDNSDRNGNLHVSELQKLLNDARISQDRKEKDDLRERVEEIEKDFKIMKDDVDSLWERVIYGDDD